MAYARRQKGLNQIQYLGSCIIVPDDEESASEEVVEGVQISRVEERKDGDALQDSVNTEGEIEAPSADARVTESIQGTAQVLPARIAVAPVQLALGGKDTDWALVKAKLGRSGGYTKDSYRTKQRRYHELLERKQCVVSVSK